jgi:hypothetical protein
MTSDQELYAKALEIAVLMLGKSLRPERQQELNKLSYQRMVDDYADLAKEVAKKILDAPKITWP